MKSTSWEGAPHWLVPALFTAALLVSLSLGLQMKDCGKIASKHVSSNRSSNATDWPWMVALLRNNRHYCGGVLISNQHILTAAHCIEPLNITNIGVRVGEYDLNTKDESRHRDYRIMESHIHEKYDPATYENDIAILKLRTSILFNTYVWPICLPPENASFENKTATVAGWGTLYYGGPSSPVLMEVDIPIWNLSDCVKRFTQPILETHLCAGAYEGGKDSCQGDSGGPLMFYEDDHWMTIGVVSWGIMCGNPQSPGIYTRTTKYLNWIAQKTSL